jgi:hypothetical protein
VKIRIADTDTPVRMLKPSLDTDMEDGAIVLRGVLDPATLANLKIDNYQREVQSAYQRRELLAGLERGDRFPDIEVGMRGDHFEVSPDDAFAMLLDPTFIIDGWQRVYSCREHLDRHPTANVRLGAVVRFNTTPEYERGRFAKLNMNRSRVAPSVLLRNFKEESHFLATLYGLTQQADFVLYGKVCWNQNKNRGEVITGASYVMLMFDMHYRFVPSSHLRGVIEHGARLVTRIGLPNVRHNAQVFWTLVHDAWGVREVSGRSASPQTRSTFLKTLARVLNDNQNFWQDAGTRLVIAPDFRKRFALFNLNDPEVNRLCTGTGSAAASLAFLILKHLDAGRRTGRLQQWDERALARMNEDA